MFYEREVMLGSTAETNPMHAIISRCFVQHISDYTSWRPLEFSEDDIFVCEARYADKQKNIIKISSLADIPVPPSLPPRETIAITNVELKKVPSPFAVRPAPEEEEVRCCCGRLGFCQSGVFGIFSARFVAAIGCTPHSHDWTSSFVFLTCLCGERSLSGASTRPQRAVTR